MQAKTLVNKFLFFAFLKGNFPLHVFMVQYAWHYLQRLAVIRQQPFSLLSICIWVGCMHITHLCFKT
jgi:hypothetical protein